MSLQPEKTGRGISVNRRLITIFLISVSIGTVATVALTASQGSVTSAPTPQTVAQTDLIPPTRAAREERAIQEARRQQLLEREAALQAKEEELKKLAVRIDQQLKQLEEARKQQEEQLKAEEQRRSEEQSERVTKMVKLFKTMKPAQSAGLLDKMEEVEVKLILNRLDTKTVAKLVPSLNQPRTIRWVNDNLRMRGEK